MHKSGAELRKHIGVVTQEDNLDPDLTVEENLKYFLSHYGVTSQNSHHRSRQMLERVGLSNYASYEVEELSGGLRRRLVLARALLHLPPFLFLDEPTTGLDPEARQDFWKLILDLSEQGHAILLTTHYMEESERLCSRIALMREGEIVDQGSPPELIARVAGREVMEIEGVEENKLRTLAANRVQWLRPAGAGMALSAANTELNAIFRELEPLQARRVVRRHANLDDVFFLLTGEKLE